MKRFNCDQILKTSDTGIARSDVYLTGELNMAANLIEKIILLVVLPICAQQFFLRKEPVLNYCHSSRLTRFQR